MERVFEKRFAIHKRNYGELVYLTLAILGCSISPLFEDYQVKLILGDFFWNLKVVGSTWARISATAYLYVLSMRICVIVIESRYNWKWDILESLDEGNLNK